MITTIGESAGGKKDTRDMLVWILLRNGSAIETGMDILTHENPAVYKTSNLFNLPPRFF